MEAAHFPKEPAHTGLTILDRLPKRKKKTLKATKLTSCMNFRMIQTVIKCIETTCRAVYLYDNANKYTLIRPWRNEEQKVEKLRKRHYTGMAALQSLINRL